MRSAATSSRQPVRPLDKTKLFQALERELVESGMEDKGLARQLEDSVVDLAGYFENGERLRMLANLGSLNFEHSFLRQRKNQPWIESAIHLLLVEYRAAIRKDEASFSRWWEAWNAETNKAVWSTESSLSLLLHQQEELEPIGEVKRCFREIGEFLEGSLQRFMRARLALWEVLGTRQASSKPLADMSFGEVATELIAGDPSEIYRPAPFGISVSQWRNIALHNSFEMPDDGTIRVAYGAANRRKSLDLTQLDLVRLLSHCNDVCYVHKIARDFFFFDHFDALKSVSIREPTPASAGGLHHSLVCNLAYRLVSSGFSILHATLDAKGWIFNLKDKLGRKEKEAKALLQEACWSYTLGNGPTEYRAVVFSKTRTFRISFKSAIAIDGEPMPEGFSGPGRKVDENFSLEPDRPGS
jgi:hypothetical protein